MKHLIFIILLIILPLNANGKIVQEKNADGSITYTNIYEPPPKNAKKEDPNVGENIDEIKVYDISTKKIKKSSNYVYVAIKVKVKNYSSDSDVSLLVECIDNNGFQLDTTYVDGIIRKGKTGYLTGQEMIEKDIYPKIKEWRAKP